LGGMELEDAACYRAVLARDARYDGRFFTCVRTTGIYCRPICPARPPKRENCSFVPSAAAAQEAGYRPCLRCRPESSPTFDAWLGTSATVSRALKLIEGGALDESHIDSLAARLQIGARQLRRVFRQHVGAAPITVAQTRRVLLAKQLIHQTQLGMTEIALASGFGSLRRFNETFRRMYGRAPSQLRRGSTGASPDSGISLLLPYRPPYDWEAMLQFLATRAIAGVETVTPGCYARAIEVGGHVGSIHVTQVPGEPALRVIVRFPQLAALPTIIARTRRLFDLGADPLAILDTLKSDSVLAPLVRARPGLRVPGAWDGFEIAVRAVLGQQISVAEATRLGTRLVSMLSEPVGEALAHPGLTRVFPRPEAFSIAGLASLGVPRSRIECIHGIAVAARTQPDLFDPCRDLATAVARLREIAGVGEWTAQYIAMRGLGESDAFLASDAALQRALAVRGKRPSAAELLARAEEWRPWRAYAVLHVWMSAAAGAVARAAQTPLGRTPGASPSLSSGPSRTAV
jgi:AraC family transcriptional regulator, regulatory protein of adaptative response / DNA-3-methyladenine glycosylase II